MKNPLPSADLDARVADAVRVIRTETSLVPSIGITLGSGLGGTIDALADARSFPTADLPHWPRSTVPGHAGRFALGLWNGVPVAALAGRSHRYEGYTLDRVTFGLRVMHALGARVMIFTSAVGGIHPGYEPGDLMLATDHINFIGKRGLLTPAEIAERRLGRRVVSVYSPALRARLVDAALRARVHLHLGVLMGSHGPSYETAAEVRMASRLGADAACMSTVHETLAAAQIGCECASISCITNRATGLSNAPLSHADVTIVADQGARKIRAVLDEFTRAEAAGH